MSPKLIPNNTSLKTVVRGYKHLFPPVLNISVTMPVGPLVFLLMSFRAVSTSLSSIIDTGPSTFACTILSTYFPHSSTFPCYSSKIFCYPLSPVPLLSVPSSNLHLKYHAPPLPSALQFRTTHDLHDWFQSSLNSFPRYLIHCSSYNSTTFFASQSCLPAPSLRLHFQISNNCFLLLRATATWFHH